MPSACACAVSSGAGSTTVARRLNRRAKASATTPVEPPMSSSVRVAAPVHVGREQITALDRVLALLLLNGARVDQPAVERADQRTVGARVEVAVRRRGHDRIEKDQAAAAAAGRAVPDSRTDRDASGRRTPCRRRGCSVRPGPSAARRNRSRAPQSVRRACPSRRSPSVRQPFLDRQLGGRERVGDARARLAVAVQPIRLRPAAA